MMGWGCPVYNGISGAGGSWNLLGMLPSLLMSLGFLIVLVAGAVWLTRRGRLSEARVPSQHSALDPLSIARHRLAAGEITPAEFEEIRERIRS